MAVMTRPALLPSPGFPRPPSTGGLPTEWSCRQSHRVREKLWSYSDLMALRIVSWLRHAKHAEAGELLPASPMPRVRRAMALIDEIGLELWWRAPADEHDSPLLVDAGGNIYVRDGDQVLNLDRQPTLLPDRTFGLTAPFTAAGGDGPDLRVPRPHLRIVPAKVTGEPHIEHSPSDYADGRRPCRSRLQFRTNRCQGPP